jgi:secondary thiamine-phosphate synthase enzyme
LRDPAIGVFGKRCCLSTYRYFSFTGGAPHSRDDRLGSDGTGPEEPRWSQHAALEGALTVKTATFMLRTAGREVVVDITARCTGFAREAAAGGDGLLHVFVPHATAGLAVMELGAGSDADLLAVLADLLPGDDRWRHSHGSRGHGRSHVLPAFLPPYATLPVVGGALALGTWQSIALVDLNADNTERTVRLSLIG